jgi:hypothetical protein
MMAGKKFNSIGQFKTQDMNEHKKTDNGKLL